MAQCQPAMFKGAVKVHLCSVPSCLFGLAFTFSHTFRYRRRGHLARHFSRPPGTLLEADRVSSLRFRRVKRADRSGGGGDGGGASGSVSRQLGGPLHAASTTPRRVAALAWRRRHCQGHAATAAGRHGLARRGLGGEPRPRGRGRPAAPHARDGRRGGGRRGGRRPRRGPATRSRRRPPAAGRPPTGRGSRRRGPRGGRGGGTPRANYPCHGCGGRWAGMCAPRTSTTRPRHAPHCLFPPRVHADGRAGA